MNVSRLYVLIAIVVLAVIALILVFTGKKEKKPLSKTAILAFAFIIAGIVFGENRITGYGLMGIGIILAVIDIVRKVKVEK